MFCNLLTLPECRSVITISASPLRASQTGVAMPEPSERKVVKDCADRDGCHGAFLARELWSDLPSLTQLEKNGFVRRSPGQRSGSSRFEITAHNGRRRSEQGSWPPRRKSSGCGRPEQPSCHLLVFTHHDASAAPSLPRRGLLAGLLVAGFVVCRLLHPNRQQLNFDTEEPST